MRFEKMPHFLNTPPKVVMFICCLSMRLKHGGKVRLGYFEMSKLVYALVTPPVVDGCV